MTGKQPLKKPPPAPPKKEKAQVQIITIPEKKMEAYNKYIWGSGESIFVATEVKKLTPDGGTQPRVLFVTTAAVYIFKSKSFSGVEVEKHFTVIDLKKVSFIEPDNFVVTYKQDKQIAFRSASALGICRLLLMQHACNFYQVPFGSKIKVESSPAKALEYVRCPVRPIGALQSRMVTLSHYYRSPFPQSLVKVFKEWDQTHMGTFLIDDTFEVSATAAKAITHAIAWDSDIKVINFKKFSVGTFSICLQTLFQQSFSINKLFIESYSQPTSELFDLKACDETSISSIYFKDCHPTYVVNIFKGLLNFNGRIRAIGFTNCSLSNNDWSAVFECIQKYPCFMKLSQVRFEDFMVETFPVKLVIQTISKMRSMKNLFFSRSRSDLSDMISVLLAEAPTVAHIEIDHCRLRKNCFAKNAPNVTFVSLSNCNISPQFFTTFMKLMLGRTRGRPFLLDISNLEGNQLDDLFTELAKEEIKPMICELNYTGNVITSKAAPSFLKFIEKQKGSLQYLNLTGSIGCPEIIKGILAFCQSSSITGIELGPNNPKNFIPEFMEFLNGLKAAKNVTDLTLMNSAIGDAGVEAIIEVARANSMHELAFDGVGISSQAEWCRFFDEIAAMDFLKAVGTPRREQTQLGITKEKLTEATRKTLMALKKKRMPASQATRLAQYERIEYEEGDAQQGSGAVRRAKTNPLEELDSVVTGMVGVICHISAQELSPYETARLIIDNIATSTTKLASQEGKATRKIVGSIFGE